MLPTMFGFEEYYAVASVFWVAVHVSTNSDGVQIIGSRYATAETSDDAMGLVVNEMITEGYKSVSILSVVRVLDLIEEVIRLKRVDDMLSDVNLDGEGETN